MSISICRSSPNPNIPSSLPPSLPSSRARESPSVRRSCCASFLRYCLSVPLSSSPDPLCPPIPNSQCFSLHSPLLSQEDYVPTHLYSPRDSGSGDGGGELTSESSDAAVEKEGIWTMKEHRSFCFSSPFGNLTLREVDMSPKLDRSLTCIQDTHSMRRDGDSRGR